MNTGKSKLVIWGAGGHALVVAEIVALEPRYELAGFLDNTHATRHGTPFCGATILGGEEQLAGLRAHGVTHALVAVGDCRARLSLAATLQRAGFELATALHPRAIVSPQARVGSGTVVAAGAIINPGTTLGSNVIVNTGAVVDHECAIADGAHLCPGVTLAGHVVIGRAAWIGIGSTVSDRITIGDDTLVGAGSVVVENLPNGVVAYGCPARVIRERTFS